ncbi:PREDICTED: oligoribonuclease [Tarenaya hassleriana]|uniref:oligoribonuclease n=1 Tax=Tarenaya hassleriana TaxID=28532 RepID=UPI00053C831D|nr:PREDICTED: oligoribonuclease [Tarenaya hassleriana]XP_019056526.1 PREDICTED: oligoribonuclease [Tarenaya hassleriana]
MKTQFRSTIKFIKLTMDRLSNVFSLLAFADEDAPTKAPAPATSSSPATASSPSSSSSSGRQGEKVNGSIELEGFKQPLVWIDLEMTGLNIEVDRILEIACIITDGRLTKSVEGPDLVIHQTKDCLDKMGEWCQTHHAASGLTEKVLQSTISESEAENQVMEFVKKHVGSETPLLAGNSVYVDFQFLKKYMPDLAALFSHVVVDVSSVTALCIRWYPKERRKAPTKQNKHRALDDIRESINELKFYKESIFKANKSRR